MRNDYYESFFDIDGSGDLDSREEFMMNFHIRELYEEEERSIDEEEEERQELKDMIEYSGMSREELSDFMDKDDIEDLFDDGDDW